MSNLETEHCQLHLTESTPKSATKSMDSCRIQLDFEENPQAIPTMASDDKLAQETVSYTNENVTDENITDIYVNESKKDLRSLRNSNFQPYKKHVRDSKPKNITETSQQEKSNHNFTDKTRSVKDNTNFTDDVIKSDAKNVINNSDYYGCDKGLATITEDVIDKSLTTITEDDYDMTASFIGDWDMLTITTSNIVFQKGSCTSTVLEY